MTDTNEQPKLYTEAQLFELFQRFKAEEQATTQRAREERELPLEIITALEDITEQQHLDNFKRYKRDISKYHHEEWTVGEEINKAFLPKLKNYTVDTTQVVNAHYKGSEINRIHGRAATELYEQLNTIKEGNLSPEDAHQLLDETIESAKRLAIHARKHDEDAKHYATKALKLPQSLKHLESRESSTKRDAFSTEFVESYYGASFQEDLLRQSANTSNQYSNRGRGWNNNYNNGGRRGRGKNFQGGRGRGTFNSSNNQNNSHNNSATQNEPTNNQ